MFSRNSTKVTVDAISRDKIDEMISVCEAISRGDFEARIKNITPIEGCERELSLRINEMIDRSDAYVRESTACLSFIAQNEYFRRIAEHGMLGSFCEATRQINSAADKVEKKMETFADIVGTIGSASTQLNSSAQSMGSSVQSATEKSSNVAAGAEQAGVNTQTVAAAAEELNSSIQEISRQVNQSATMAKEAVVEADNANSLVMGLSKASSEIEHVVGLINDIASQTNLLALNATIEAARAGDAGKGFAVVASEVKNLATQTATATEDIKRQVSEIQAATSTAVGSIGDIAQSIGKFNEVSSAIASAVEEQGAATQEIARNVQEAASGVAEITTNIALVNDNVSEVSSMSNEVLSVSENLASHAGTLEVTLNS